jgi:hypothetical protein
VFSEGGHFMTLFRGNGSAGVNRKAAEGYKGRISKEDELKHGADLKTSMPASSQIPSAPRSGRIGPSEPTHESSPIDDLAQCEVSAAEDACWRLR